MYSLNAAFEFACQPPNRLLFAGPGGEFIIIDTSGLIRGLLEAIKDGEPLEFIFSEIADENQRTIAQDRILGVLTERRIIQRDADADWSNRRALSRDVLCDWLGFFGARAPIPAFALSGDPILSGFVKTEMAALGLPTTAETDDRQVSENVMIFCQDKPDRAALRAANVLAVARKSTFFPIMLDRHIITLGPFIIPGATACMECLHHRETMNRASPDGEIGKYLTPAPSPFTARLAAMLGVQTFARFLFGTVQDMHQATLTRHSVLTGKTATSVILKLPRCPVCSGPALQKPLASSFSLVAPSLVQAAE